MIWKTMSFERQKLFDEVWATPMTKLAKTYGLSDVGLRKICVTLDVPLPPRGFWAKLAVGKTIPKPILHKTSAPETYQRVTNVAKVDEKLDERIANALNSARALDKTDIPTYTPPRDPTTYSPQAILVIRAMKRTKLTEGVRSSVGVTWSDISVSESLEERALLLVDRFAYELTAIEAKFENSHPPLPPVRRGARREYGMKRNGFTLHGHEYFIHIRERIKQELVPPPPPKPSRAGTHQPTWTFRPPEYRYIPTGKLFASIASASSHYECCKLEDSARETIELKIKKAVQRVADSAIRQNVESEVRAERELIRRKKSQEWEVAKAAKDALLAKLNAFEKMAKDLDRAKSFRRLAEEIATSKAAPPELVNNLELLVLMADWLDPLVKAPWPEVDNVADKNPYGGLGL